MRSNFLRSSSVVPRAARPPGTEAARKRAKRKRGGSAHGASPAQRAATASVGCL